MNLYRPHVQVNLELNVAGVEMLPHPDGAWLYRGEVMALVQQMSYETERWESFDQAFYAIKELLEALQ